MQSETAVPVGSEQANRAIADAEIGATSALYQQNPITTPVATPVANGDGAPRRLISRDAIRGRPTRRYMEIVVPEWDNATVRIQNLTADERDSYEESFYKLNRRTGEKEQNLTHMRARLTRMSVVDDNGALIFTDEDEGWLGEQDAAALDRIFTASARFSRISKVDIEDDVKNSKRTR